MKTQSARHRSGAASFALAVAVALAFSAASVPSAAHAATTFTSSGTSESVRPWLGFGINEYPVDRNSSGTDIAWTTADLNLTEARLAYLEPAINRINWYTQWFNPSGTAGVYDWTGLEATGAFQIMDYLNAHHMPVQLGLWGPQNSGNSESYYTSQAFANKQADFINYMLNVRGYTNIEYYAATNEPNLSGFTYADWSTMLTTLKSTLIADGLPVSILVGTDASQQANWLAQTGADHVGDISGYEAHYYPSSALVSSTEAYTRQHVSAYQDQHAPAYLSEMGIGNPDTGSATNTFGYGLDMFDYGAQVGRSGASSAMAWCLDGFDRGKNCGMWDISGQNQTAGQLRPWFYTWSLLERSFPAGWTTAQMPETATTHILAAHSVGSSADWSFAVVNRDTQDTQVTLKVPGWGSGTFNEYLYSPSSAPTDANGFPVATATIATGSGGLANGVTVTVPAGSAVVLTTLGQSQIASSSSTSTGNIIDHMTDWSHTYSHTANLAIDSGNTQYFMGDTGRVKRTTNTTENVIYNITSGVSGYLARVYLFGADGGDVAVQSSTDGSTWSNTSSTATPEISTGGSWGFENISNATTLPTGTKFIRIVLSTDPNVYGPQISDVNVFGSSTFTSGLESGQTQPTWTNTVDTGPEASAGNTSNVTSPTMQVSTARAHSGAESLRYAGTATSSTSSDYAYMKVFDLTGTAVVVQPNTTVTYWVYPESSSANPSDTGRNSACINADIDFSDGTALRSLGAPVQENASNLQSACRALTLDTWDEVVVSLGPVAIGKTIDKIDFAYDQPGVTGGYSGYIDDVSLSN